MATRLYLINGFADVHRGTNTAKLNGSASAWRPSILQTTRGGGVVAETTSTVAGATNGVEVADSTTTPYEWYSSPVDADVTISGAITGNIWASESSMNANVAINFIVDKVAAIDNAITEIVKSARTTEVALTTRAVNNFTATPGAGVSLNKGDRIRVRIFGDDAGTMASGFTFNIGFSGTTAAADGDTYIEFTETFGFPSVDPSTTVVYLTNTHSGLSAVPALISDFTGSNENPLSEGGNWANINSSGSVLERVSNAVKCSFASAAGAYWTPANFGPDLDAYVTLSTVGDAGIAARIQGEGGAATWDGYAVRLISGVVNIYVVTNATFTSLASNSGVSWASGDKLGIRIEGSTIQGWRQASGSSDWNLVCTAVDTTYSSAGKIGLVFVSATAVLDDFYAATDSNLFTQRAWTSRGAGVVSYLSRTTAGWTSPLLTNEWFTPQLQAFTLSGLVTARIRMLESNAAANASVRLEVARVDSDGTNASVWASWGNAPSQNGHPDVGELGTSERNEFFRLSGDDLAISDGQRIRIRVYLEDAPYNGPLVTGHTATVFYNGTTADASGDTWVTFGQTLAEFSSTPVPRHAGVDHMNPGLLMRARDAWEHKGSILVPRLWAPEGVTI